MAYEHICLEEVWQWPGDLQIAPLFVIDARVMLVKLMQKAEMTFGKNIDYSSRFMQNWCTANWALQINMPANNILQQPSTGWRVIIVDDWRCNCTDNNYWRNKYLLDRGFEPYKGNRDTTRGPAYTALHESLLAYANSPRSNFKVFREAGFEADDWAGAIAKLKLAGKAKDRYCIMLSCDHDWLQLVNDSTNVLWLNSFKHKPLLRNESEHLLYMVERKGIVHYSPRDLVDYKVRNGDAGDNLAPSSPRECIDLLHPAMQLPAFALQMLEQELACSASNTNAEHAKQAKAWLDKLVITY